MRTFLPPIPPDLGAADERVFTVHKVSFGDGYSQRAAAGLNSRGRTVTLSWSLLAPEEADAICAFFDAHLGAAAFLYRRPDEAGPRKWTVERYTRRTVRPMLRAVTATLTEVFDLE